MDLTGKKCVPCEGGVPTLTKQEIKEQLKNIHVDWGINSNKLMRSFSFINFRHTMDFVNKIAELAEAEGHHPDLLVSYGKCDIYLWTHAIKGLSLNDFILAAKIDQID